jgi:hypothetical protein
MSETRHARSFAAPLRWFWRGCFPGAFPADFREALNRNLPAAYSGTVQADFVAKVFLHSRSKFLLAVQATSI